MPSPTRRNWTRPEALIAFRLYCNTEFGKLHEHNPEIIELAKKLDRTPGAVGMKACNFASLDPRHRERGRTGLANVSQLDKQIWAEFKDDPETIADEAEIEYTRLMQIDSVPLAPPAETDVIFPDGPTEKERTVRVRRVQGFFRNTVLVSYEHRCALTGLDIPQLLRASHIIPWSVSVERRADPQNGLCLNVMIDRAFDCGLISFKDDLSVMISERITMDRELLIASTGLRGRRLKLPVRFMPDLEALAFHRAHIFDK